MDDGGGEGRLGWMCGYGRVHDGVARAGRCMMKAWRDRRGKV